MKHTRCWAPGPHCPRGWAESGEKQHLHYTTTILPPPPWPRCLVDASETLCNCEVPWGWGKEEKVPPGHALAPPSPAPQLHQSGSAPRLPFWFRKRLDSYCPGGRQNASTPRRVVIRRSNPTEINSSPTASPHAAAQVFQSLTLLQWMHLESITRPLLHVIDEQLKCA